MHFNSLVLFFICCCVCTAGQQVQAQHQAVIYGQILDRNNNPVEDVTVSVFGQSLPPVYTDKEGKYEYTVPAQEEITIVFTHLSYIQEKQKINLEPGARLEISKSLKPALKTALDSVEVSDTRRNQSLYRIDPKHHSTIPTASGDFNAILFSQPGVANRNELSSQYSVRGGNFDENLVYVNDIEVYRPFLVRSGQQEGLSFVNPDMVSSILFSAGGFEARYGDKMSSVLDIKYRRPRKFAGTASASMLGGNLHLEGTSPDYRFTWLVGSRYKSNQYVLGSLDTKADYRPSFTDVQAYFTYDLSDVWELDFLGNYAKNKYHVVPETRETDFGMLKEALRLTVYFDGQEIDAFQTQMGALSALYHPHEKLNLKFITSVFQTNESETFDIQGQYWIHELETDFGKENFGKEKFKRGVGTFLNHARNYLNANVYNLEHKGTWAERTLPVLWGVKYQHEAVNDKLSEWQMIDSSGYALPHYPLESIDLQEVVRTKINVSSNRLSGYVQTAWSKETKDTAKITLTAGARANYWDLNTQTVISPRVTFAYKPNWKKDILFRASGGYYYQPPFYRELRDLKGVVHLDVKAQKSIHFVLASDLNFTAWRRPFKFVSELYYKYLDNLVPYEIDNVRIRYYAKNNARGYARGIDLKVNGEFVSGIESWASLSVMQTYEDITDDYYYDYYNSKGEKIIPGATIDEKASDSIRREPGYIPRPTNQLVNFGLYFQDYLPRLPDCKMHLNLLFGTALPFGPPSYERYKDTLKMPPYRRVDIGFSYQLLKEGKKLEDHNPFRHLNSVWLSMEVFNLLQVNNTVSYIWIRDIYNNQYAIPNYLTARQLNLRVVAKF